MPRSKNNAKRRRGPGRALLRQHRRVGVALSAVFLLVCVTGIALNHQDDLPSLSQTVRADWIYDWYGIAPEGDIVHYELERGSLSELDGQVYFTGAPLGYFGSLTGVAELEGLLAFAHGPQLTLLTQSGERVETLPDSAIPGTRIERLASPDRRILAIETDAGVFLSDESILEWTPADAQRAALSDLRPSPPTPELKETILQAYRGEGLTWGRIVLDLHTGRFFGDIGKWIVDLSALALLFLTATGLVYTFKYLNKARQRSD